MAKSEVCVLCAGGTCLHAHIHKMFFTLGYHKKSAHHCRSTRCMDIFADLDDQLTDYCADQRAMCQQTGSYIHIVCEYYGKTGSACSRFREVPLDESNVNEILHRINTMRIHVAKGEAIGQDLRELPQGYGMKKVFWDSELAAFAQIMIAQCLAKNRYSCAATRNFSNPLMDYSFTNITSSAAAIIDSIFSSWEVGPHITRDEIFRSPDLKGRESQFYIKMVVGDVTHVGCAVGVYEHEIGPFAIKAFDNKQLSGHMICYMSHYSRPGAPVYNTTAPVKGTGWTRCGCPPKYRETKDCLCVPSPRTDLTTTQHTTASTIKNITTSTQAYYDNYEKYINDMRQIYDATERQQEFSKIQPLDRKTEHKLKSTPPKKWTRANLKQETAVGTPTPTCNGQGKCEPKIVMLPIFTIQNAPKNRSRKKAPGHYRRSGNTSSVQTAKATDKLSLSEEMNDGLPKNISLRSKLLQSLREFRNKEGLHFFSYEQNEPDHQFMEHNQRIVEPFERILGSTHLIGETTTQQSDDERDRNEKAKKRVNNLLDLLEEKGKKAQLTSREIIEFDAKMRRIYNIVLGTRERYQF